MCVVKPPLTENMNKVVYLRVKATLTTDSKIGWQKERCQNKGIVHTNLGWQKGYAFCTFALHLPKTLHA